MRKGEAVESLNQGPHLVIGSEVHRTQEGVHTPPPQPVAGRPEEGGGGFRVIDRVEEPEMAGPGGVKVVVVAVDVGADTSEGFAIGGAHQEEGRLGVGEEGVFRRVEEASPLHLQVGDVKLRVTVEAEGEPYELCEVATVVDLADGQTR